MKRYLIGAGVAVGAYMLYRFKTKIEPAIQLGQNRAAQPSEIFAAVDLGDPGLYAAAAAGLLGARLLR